MKQENCSDTVFKTMSYYNSSDADNFYFNIWGGADIHIGMYLTSKEDISVASHRTIEVMMASIRNKNKHLNVLDIGGGYGGPARAIAKCFNHNITILNLSEIQNARCRNLNTQLGLDNKIKVMEGNFESIPFARDEFDIVWSQDAILHSNNRETVFQEVYRVLKPNGEFIFTDPMRSNDTKNSAIKPILDRIHLDSLSSPEEYFAIAKQVNFSEQRFYDFSHKLPLHYQRVLEETEKREKELTEIHKISEQFIYNMKHGLLNWVNGGNEEKLTWGIFNFSK